MAALPRGARRYRGLAAPASRALDRHIAAALAAARLLVPVVAVRADGSSAEGDKNSEMVLPTLIGQDGRPAVLAFTGLGTLARTIHPYPTQAEAIKKVADAYNRTRLTPLIKKLFSKWLTWTR